MGWISEDSCSFGCSFGAGYDWVYAGILEYMDGRRDFLDINRQKLE